MHDQRLISRLENYWDLLCKGRPMPEIQQLNPGSIDDMWPQCVNMGIFKTQGGHMYNYIFMGEKIADLYGRNLTGEVVHRNTNGYPLNLVVKKLDAVRESKKFEVDTNQFVNERSKIVKYRACFMPFGSEAKGVTNIVVGFSGREF